MQVSMRFVLLLGVLLSAVPADAQKTTEPQPMAGPGQSSEPPPPKAAPVGTVVQQALPRSGGVLVFGGAEGTGLALVKELVSNQNHVTVVANQATSDAALTSMGVAVVQANLLDAETLKSVFTAAPFRAVVSTVGESHSGSGDFTANKNIFDATKAAGVPRLIFMTEIGVGDSTEAPPWYVKVADKLFDSEGLTAKAAAEGYLRQIGLDYTIIRPGGISDHAPSGKAVLDPNSEVYSRIARADLAKLLAGSVDDETKAGKTLTAFDPTRTGFFALFD